VKSPKNHYKNFSSKKKTADKHKRHEGLQKNKSHWRLFNAHGQIMS